MRQVKKVALGMSGGVDSSLSAYLLVEQGYDVTGVYLECWRAPGCRTDEDRKDALKVALALGIPFEVLDFKQAYHERVVQSFFHEYQAGRTPNPDVLCNKEIKFGLFYDWAMERGFDFVATGHYARIVDQSKEAAIGQSNARLSLVRSKDTHKDQTYFLYRLRQDQIEHILYPIGGFTKQEVRSEAKNRSIPVAEKPDSQGICFIGEINVHNFLRERLGENPGDVVNTEGEVIGKHTGLWFYTIGQRHGFEISGTWKSKQGELRHAMPPYYVISKQPDKNRLVVGFGRESYRSEFGLEDLHWINQSYQELAILAESNLRVRIRHGGQMCRCVLKKVGEAFIVKLLEPQKGVADGQSAVFYQIGKEPDQFVCLGGGVII